MLYTDMSNKSTVIAPIHFAVPTIGVGPLARSTRTDVSPAVTVRAQHWSARTETFSSPKRAQGRKTMLSVYVGI